MHIEFGDLTRPEVVALLKVYLDAAVANSPPESMHALDLAALRAPEITFWTAWEGARLLGCGALKALSDTHGEIKSMHTAQARSEEHTSELQSLMRISYAVFCLKKKTSTAIASITITTKTNRQPDTQYVA